MLSFFFPVTIFIFALSHLSSPSVNSSWCDSIAFQPLLGIIRTWLLLRYANAQSNLNKNYLLVFSSKLVSFIQPSPESWLWGPHCSEGGEGQGGWGWRGWLRSHQHKSLSRVWLFATPWTVACQASLSFTISWSLLKLMSVESVMPPSHLILGHPLLLLPPIPPRIRVFSIESAVCIRWPKYWSFSFSIRPSSEYSVLICFRIDWFDLLAVQGTLKTSIQ